MYFNYKDYINNSDQYEEMLEEMKCNTDFFMAHFNDDPRFISGWGHGYFCNEDGGRLIYDVSKPFLHTCSICGKNYTDYIYDSYFITMFRNEAVMTSIKAAVLYNIYEEKEYLSVVKEIIGFYADNYEHFAIHAKEKINCDTTVDVGGAGKIMPQGLNEAIIAIRFINALELVKDAVEEEWLLSLKKKLFEPIYNLILPQKMHIHNIPTWINSAIGTMGLFFGDEEWINEATKNPYNLYEQIEKGVTASGFWYEGSIHYNFFALEGIMSFLVMANSYSLNTPEKIQDTVYDMLKAGYLYAFDNNRFPNPSDGWPNISLLTYSYVYYMGYKVLGKKVLPLIQHIEKSTIERTKLPLSEPYYYENRISMERLLFAPDIMDWEEQLIEKRSSTNFEASNCAILRNSYFNVFMKYGHQTKSHAHPDKMNIEIMVGNQVLTKDLSNSGYASKLCNGWHRKIAAHNTCVVNGMPTNIEQPGKVLVYNDNTIEAEAKVYDNVTYVRKIHLLGDKIEDIFTVKGTEVGTIDWFFHFETPVDRNGIELIPVALFDEYEYIKDVCEIKTETNRLSLKNDLANLEINLEDGVKAYLTQTYNNPADKMRDTLILRKIGKEASFYNTIQSR